MSAIRTKMQLVASGLGLSLLALAGVAAYLEAWRVVVAACVVVLAMMLLMVAHMHQRVGDTMRLVARGYKSLYRLQDNTDARGGSSVVEEAEPIAQLVRAAIEHDLAITQGRLTARLDAVESGLRTVGRDLVAAAGRLDERARWAAERTGPAAQTVDEGLSARALLDVVVASAAPSCRTIVQVGAGAATVLLAHTLAGTGRRMVTIEHAPDVAAAVRDQLRHQALDAVVDVRTVEVQTVVVAGQSYRWYGVEALQDVDRIDVLLLDAAETSAAGLSAYPAVPLLRSRLAHEAVIILHAAGRSDGETPVARWLDEDDDLVRRHSTTDEVVVLERHAGSGALQPRGTARMRDQVSGG